MNAGMKMMSTSAASVFLALTLGALPMVVNAQAPQLTIQSEQAAHPKIALAIREMENALYALELTKDDLGGNKPLAEKEMRNAILSLKKALYYRLKLDDAALDKAQ